MKYDKEYVKKLASSLHFDLDDKLLEQLVKDVNELYETDILAEDFSILTPNYEKLINCSKFKPDEPVKPESDALSGCKKADKYVVGK